MDTWLLCWVTFSLMEAGHTEPEVSQTPSHQVTEMGQEVILRCDPISGHLNLYWYRKILGQKVEFLISFYNENLSEKSEIFKDGFSAERSNGSFSTLKIQLTEVGDSAVYLCASS
uniref:Ig-like domain-containing protein n=1 Tax=Equus asinus TaxID=9793 RepID=A0A9L0KI55_EQUAS